MTEGRKMDHDEKASVYAACIEAAMQIEMMRIETERLKDFIKKSLTYSELVDGDYSSNSVMLAFCRANVSLEEDSYVKGKCCYVGCYADVEVYLHEEPNKLTRAAMKEVISKARIK